jgi:hypothetical protein
MEKIIKCSKPPTRECGFLCTIIWFLAPLVLAPQTWSIIQVITELWLLPAGITAGGSWFGGANPPCWEGKTSLGAASARTMTGAFISWAGHINLHSWPHTTNAKFLTGNIPAT